MSTIISRNLTISHEQDCRPERGIARSQAQKETLGTSLLQSRKLRLQMLLAHGGHASHRSGSHDVSPFLSVLRIAGFHPVSVE